MNKAFETWTSGGLRFLAWPIDTGVAVMDENGNNYGAWMGSKSFRKHYDAKDGRATVLGQIARIQVIHALQEDRVAAAI